MPTRPVQLDLVFLAEAQTEPGWSHVKDTPPTCIRRLPHPNRPGWSRTTTVWGRAKNSASAFEIAIRPPHESSCRVSALAIARRLDDEDQWPLGSVRPPSTSIVGEPHKAAPVSSGAPPRLIRRPDLGPSPVALDDDCQQLTQSDHERWLDDRRLAGQPRVVHAAAVGYPAQLAAIVGKVLLDGALNAQFGPGVEFDPDMGV